MATKRKNQKRKTGGGRLSALLAGPLGKLFWILFDICFVVAIVGILAGGIYAFLITDDLMEKFEGSRWKIAGKVYSDSLTLVPGQNVKTLNLADRLVRLNYQTIEDGPKRPGEFTVSADQFDIFTRDFRYPLETTKGFQLRLSLKNDRITALYNLSESRHIYSAELEPEVIGSFFGPDREQRDLVTYDEISPYLINALVAIEDKAFFRHHGLNFRGIARMIVINLRSWSLSQGGSSITQQLVKNFFLTNERSIERKVKEAIMAVVLEMLYTKEDIFECYLNEVYFGQSGSVSICGVGEASKFYFGKNVRSLDLAEAALLAGLVRSPNGYNPRKREHRAKIRRDYILSQMAKQGLISKEQSESAKNQGIRVLHHTPSYTVAPYFIEFLKQQLAEKYSSEVLISQGLRIFTTLDVEIQKKAEAALKTGIQDLEKRYKKLTSDPTKKLQASMIVMEPQTGYVRAMIGGRSFRQSQYNRAIQSRRQTGSVFKPFVYATAFAFSQKGKLEFKPTSLIIDEPMAVPTGAGTWRPQNYSKKYIGPVTARKALEKSINIPAVKVAQMIGIENVIETAGKMGIKTALPPYPAIALGSADLSLLEVSNAYATLATLGSHTEPMSIRDVVDQNGTVLDKKTLRVKRAIPAGAAYQTVSVMKGVLDRGTAVRARSMGFNAPAAGKTGTTDNYRDAWFVGFTPNILAGVWVGFDQQKNLGLAGSTAALPIWTNFMKAQLANTAVSDWDPPDSIVFKKIDYTNGHLAVYGCPNVIEEAFIKGTEPETECAKHKDSVIEFFKKKVGTDAQP